MRALIADDDPMTTVILSKTLQKGGIEVSVVHDGEAAWAQLSEEGGPSLAIIDWMMPGLDGPEICRRVRGTPALAGTYLILLTGRDTRADLVAGLTAGADDYVVKPFDADEIRARVNVGIRVLTLQQQLDEQLAALTKARDDLARLASTDTLTGACSRRHWFELAAVEFTRFRRYARPVSLLMADLDRFKRVNDTYGHETGDYVLKRFAGVLQAGCRESDVVGRMGGEEFAIMLPETSLESACEVAGRIVESCRGLVVRTPAGEVTFSCSVGVAAASAADANLEDVLRRADEGLYEAKRGGRDRWISREPGSLLLNSVRS